MGSMLDEEQVRVLFASCTKECDVLLGLYGLAIPEWDRVEFITEGKPCIGEAAWHAIYDLFKKFNEDHPGENLFPGGLWLGQGFSIDKSLGPWEIDISGMKILWKSQ